MRRRIVWVAFASLAAVAAAAAYATWPSAGEREMRAVTERVADALARSDREALAAEPLLQNDSETITWLLERGPALASGYRVSVKRNGGDGHYLLSLDDVTHLGEITGPGGTITLGFRYDRRSGRLEFVTASFTSIT